MPSFEFFGAQSTVHFQDAVHAQERRKSLLRLLSWTSELVDFVAKGRAFD
jgi:hypothetical protein